MFFVNILWYFVIFSFLGWLFNGIRNLFLEHKFYNKGFLTSCFCPTYGFSAIICDLALRPFVSNKIVLLFGSAIILSALSVVIGTFTEKLLGCKPWDYSDLKFSIGSYITLPYALLLGVSGTLLVGVIIPVLNTVLDLIPFNISLIVVLSICGLIFIDYSLSIVTISISP